MTVLTDLALLLAGPGAGGEHRWGDGGWPWLWGPLMLVLWLGLTAAVVWLVARGVRPPERSAVDRARDLLAERYARGEITSDEYRERLDQLR
jgi:putative membrane protein